MNGNTRELLKRVLDFIQIHRDLQRNSPIQEIDLHPFIHPFKFVDLAIIPRPNPRTERGARKNRKGLVAWRLTCPRGQVRCIYTTSGATGQTGLTDHSDRSLPRNVLHPDSNTKMPVGAKPQRVQDLIRRQSFFVRLEAFSAMPPRRCRSDPRF